MLKLGVENSGAENVISGWRALKLPNDPEKPENNLPREYQESLKKVKEIAPEGFYKQAVKCAQLFHNLDQGIVSEEENNFANELANLPSIASIDVFDNFGGVGFEEATPLWLHNKREISTKNDNDFEKVANFYKNYVEKKALSIRREMNGEYADYDAEICPPYDDSLINNFKAYIEKGADLKKLFDELETSKLHPHSSKLFDGDRLVLYWYSPLQESEEKLKNIFGSSGVIFRGFGQDPVRLEVTESGNWKLKVVGSSDKARGEAGGGENFFRYKYDKRNFFELYLRQMFRWGRNPLDPYKNSFVPIIGDIDKVNDKDGFTSLVEKIKNAGLGIKKCENVRDLFLFDK